MRELQAKVKDRETQIAELTAKLQEHQQAYLAQHGKDRAEIEALNNKLFESGAASIAGLKANLQRATAVLAATGDGREEVRRLLILMRCLWCSRQQALGCRSAWNQALTLVACVQGPTSVLCEEPLLPASNDSCVSSVCTQVPYEQLRLLLEERTSECEVLRNRLEQREASLEVMRRNYEAQVGVSLAGHKLTGAAGCK